MSNLVGEARVRIRPDFTNFVQEAKAELTANLPQLQAQQQQLFERAFTARDQAADVRQLELVGKASAEQSEQALLAYTQAAQAAAKADVELSLAQGQATVTMQSSVELLNRDTVATKENTVAKERQAQTFRSQLRNVTEGQASLGSLIGPASLARFALAGVAVGAIFTGMQELTKALRVTGDEAFTTEGRLRNLGAELLSGNLVGGIRAIVAEAPTAAEQLKKITTEGKASQGELSAFADKASVAASKLGQLDSANQKLGASESAMGREIHKAAEETQKAADDARNLAASYVLAGQAAADMAAQIQHAGSEAAQFGERTRGPGDIPNILTPQGDPGVTPDSTATTANANAIAEAQARTLRDKLRVAQDEARQIKEQINAAIRAGGEGTQALAAAQARKQAQIADIQDQIDAEAKQARDEATRKAEQAARDAETAANKAHALYAQRVANDVKRLAIAADAAGNVGRAETAYTNRLKKAANDSKLNTQEQLGYQAELTNQRQVQTAAIEAQAKAEVARRLALDDLRIQQADLTPGTSDNERAINKKIKDLRQLRSKTKEYSDEWIAYTSQITDLRLRLQGLTSGGQAFTLQQLFQESANQFKTFGSNVVQPGGILSGQDARAAFAGQILGSGGDVPRAQLTEQQRTNAILTAMEATLRAQGVGLKPAAHGQQGNLLAAYGSQIAAAYGIGPGSG